MHSYRPLRGILFYCLFFFLSPGVAETAEPIPERFLPIDGKICEDGAASLTGRRQTVRMRPRSSRVEIALDQKPAGELHGHPTKVGKNTLRRRNNKGNFIFFQVSQLNNPQDNHRTAAIDHPVKHIINEYRYVRHAHHSR